MKVHSKPSLNGSILAVSLVTALLLYFYGPVFFSPGDYLLAGKGDGLKNYYSFMYHVAHDEGVNEFKGMNYPYPELFIYTDGNPLLAAFIKWTEPYFGLSAHSIALYNLSILLALPLAALFFSLTFRKLGVSTVCNGLFTLGIVMLHPQVERMGGHTTLAYLWVLPMVIYAYLKVRTHLNPIRQSIVFGLLILASFFLHPYLGTVSCAFLGLALIVDLFQLRKGTIKAVNVGSVAIMSIVPLLCFLAYSKLIDPVSDRVPIPWGFFKSQSELQSIFLPHSGPLHKLFTSLYSGLGIDWPKQNWEGLAYVGFTAVLTGVWWLVHFIKNRQSIQFGYWTSLWVAGVVLLLFSFCIPFRWGGVFLDILDQFSIIRQFRALGRFTWPFYHVAVLSALIFIYRKSIRSEKKLLKVLPFAAALLMIAEGWETHQKMGAEVSKYAQPFSPEEPLLKGIDHSNYNAILSLPHFQVGTDYYAANSPHEVVRESMLLSYETGLPLISSMMARSSMSQTIDKVGLYEWGRATNPIAQDLPIGDKYIVVADTNALTDMHRNILSLARPLKAVLPGVSLYEIDCAALLINQWDSIRERAQVLKADTLRSAAGEYPNAAVHFDGFQQEENTSEEGFYSSRAKSGHRNGYFSLAEIQADQIAWGEPHELLLWVKGNRIENNGIIVITEKEPSDGSEHWDHLTGLNRFIATRGEWHLSRLIFTPKRKGGLKLLIFGDWHDRQELTVDRLLVRKVDQEVFSEEDGVLWWNNLPIPIED